MPRAYTAAAKRQVNATSGESLFLLLEIDHPDLAAPIRVINDTQDLVSNGNTFVGFEYDVELPDDMDKQLPRARLIVSNVGREMVQWLEVSGGGEGATCRIMQVKRSDPDTIEWEITMDLSNVSIDVLNVSGALGFEDILNKPAVALEYRPDVAPELF